MTYSYDRRTAAVPPSLGHRSGYELRVVGFLSDVWPFQVQSGRGNDEADMLDVAARGVDTMKRKHPDLWKGMVEANLHPKEVADIIVSVALKDSGFKNATTRTAANLVESVTDLLEEVSQSCTGMIALAKRLEAKVKEVRALEQAGTLKRLEKGRGATLSGTLEDNLRRVNKGHYDDAAEWCGKLAKYLKKDPPEGL